MTRAVRIAFKDLRVLSRDPFALAMLLVMPAVAIVIMTSAFGEFDRGITSIRGAVVDSDGGRQAREVAEALLENPEVRELLHLERADDARRTEARVAKGELAAAIVIPAGFSSALRQGRTATITVYEDPGRPVSAALVAGVARSAASRSSAAVAVERFARRRPSPAGSTKAAASPDVLATEGTRRRAVAEALPPEALALVGVDRSEVGPDPSVSMVDFRSSSMAITFLVFGVMFGAGSVTAERCSRTLSRLLATPATPREVLAGKALGVVLLAVVQFAILWLFATALGADWGKPPLVLLVGLALGVALAGLSMLLGVLAPQVRAVNGIAAGIGALFAIFGGTATSIALYPAWMRPLRFLTFNGWAMDAMDRLQRGDGPERILFDSAVLAAVGSLLLLLAARAMRSKAGAVS